MDNPGIHEESNLTILNGSVNLIGKIYNENTKNFQVDRINRYFLHILPTEYYGLDLCPSNSQVNSFNIALLFKAAFHVPPKKSSSNFLARF